MRAAWLLLQRVQNKTWHDLACFCLMLDKMPPRCAQKDSALFSLLPSNQTGIFMGFHMLLMMLKRLLYYSMAHVVNKGADCVQNSTAPQPIFKEQDCFDILKILQGKRTFLPNLKLLFHLSTIGHK